MNWLDITLLCLAGIGFVKGLFDGVIKQVVSLIALLVGIFFCTKAALWLRGYILALGWFPEQGVTVLSYVAGFLLIVGVILMAFVSLLLNSMEMIDKGSVLIPRQAKVESRFYNSVKEIIPTIYFQNLFFKEE